MFFEREVIEGYLALNHHCQASIVGSAESYNEQFRSSPVTLYSKSFLTRNIICEIQDDLDDDEDEEVSSECKKTLSWEMSSKNLSTAMWLILVKEECIERGILSAEYLGPKLEAGIRVTFQRSLENFMERVDNWR